MCSYQGFKIFISRSKSQKQLRDFLLFTCNMNSGSREEEEEAKEKEAKEEEES